MPTPVSVARQCLTPDAAHALDEAVAVARRRGHAQTTSLHAVSALLALPSSTLRDACARARNTAYSPRLQFKALELCLSVSLDRVPSSQVSDDPPVSNSLMAAIKRSQANQRRQPENFHLYHQISQQQQSTISCIKVELQHLILSILDDPVVSRVFGEAGFRSSEIKLAIIRPLPQLLRYPRHRGPPLFLCNLTDNPDPTLHPGRRGFSFPFSGFAASFHGDENNRRIGEVLARDRGRNPLLMGVCAHDTLHGFMANIEKKKDGVLPKGISGLNVISIEHDVSKHIMENFDKGNVETKFEQMGKLAEQSLGPGLLVNYGDLKIFVNDHNNHHINISSNSSDNSNDNKNNVNGSPSDAVSYFIAQLTRLLHLHGSKIWLMGAVVSYEIYLKFVTRFPSIEKDWDLQILPITSLRPSLAESYPRSSLMESFVPFGGFFSTPSELKGSFNGSCQSTPQFREKYEPEALPISKGRVTAWVADQYPSSLPSWLQMTELRTTKSLDVKTKDDEFSLRAKVAGLQKKWDGTCQRLHHGALLPESKTYQVGGQFPTVVGFQFIEDKIEDADKHSHEDANAASNGGCRLNGNSFIPIDLQKMSSPQSHMSSPVDPEVKNRSSPSEQWDKLSKPEDLDSGGLMSPCSFSNSSTGDGGRTSPTSATSVTTDLGLRICPVPTSTALKKTTNKSQTEITKDFSGCFSANGDFFNRVMSVQPAQSSPSSCPDICGQFDLKDFKTLLRALVERVNWQDEVASVVSRTIARCRSRNDKRHGASPRGDIWFNFSGPDRCGKKKIAHALAEIIYGSKENFIHVDLGAQDVMTHEYRLSDHGEENGYDILFRGKTVVDYVAGELHQRPLSVVFLEHVDKADVLIENSLYQAIQTGKFSDSHGREVSINNTIIITTSESMKDNQILPSRKEPSNYSEEMILRAKGWPVQMVIQHASRDNAGSPNSSVYFAAGRSSSSSSLVNKRKLIITNETSEESEIAEMTKRAHRTSTMNLDLNLPAEENEVLNTDAGNPENHCENSNSWLQDFFDQIDENVVFKPFDFDALAEKISNDIIDSFQKSVNTECLLEIDSKVIQQLLGAAYQSDRNQVVEDWVEQDLNRAFAEVQKRYNPTAHSVVKLVTFQGPFREKQPAGALLPQKIIIN